jgi:hypothetical protein
VKSSPPWKISKLKKGREKPGRPNYEIFKKKKTKQNKTKNAKNVILPKNAQILDSRQVDEIVKYLFAKF